MADYRTTTRVTVIAGVATCQR